MKALLCEGSKRMDPVLELKMFVKHPVKRVRHAVKRVRHTIQVRKFRRREPELGTVIDEVREQRLTFLSPENLVDLSEAVLDADRRGLPGAIVEAGTALGGSAIVLGRSKAKDRPLWIFDAFGTIPPPSKKDGPDVHQRYEVIVSGRSPGLGGDLYYGYHDNLLGEVTESFRAFGIDPEKDAITFVKGYYEQTMSGSIRFPVAVAHLDCDWYESLMTCLREIEPQVVVGGRLVIDDYYNWSGCTDAVDEFFASKKNYRWEHRSRLHLVKLSD